MNVDVVLIGRNEGERLVKSLSSIAPQARRVVYVDSGSTDDSLANAKKFGAKTVELDMSIPFTAARARNAGYKALMMNDNPPDAVQFMDGDCIMLEGWLEHAFEKLQLIENLGLVTGRQAELNRDITIFNQLSDFEWKRPVGSIEACTGNMMVRVPAFDAVGGFDASLIAGEDDEFCTRLRKAGWHLVRIPEKMALHDGGRMRFSQWWKRAIRTGHAFAQIGHMHPEYWYRERLRGWFYGLILPVIAISGAFISFAAPVMVIGIYALSYLKTMRNLQLEGLPMHEALKQAIFLSLSKFPNFLGMLRYYWRCLRGKQMHLIEYK